MYDIPRDDYIEGYVKVSDGNRFTFEMHIKEPRILRVMQLYATITFADVNGDKVSSLFSDISDKVQTRPQDRMTSSKEEGVETLTFKEGDVRIASLILYIPFMHFGFIDWLVFEYLLHVTQKNMHLQTAKIRTKTQKLFFYNNYSFQLIQLQDITV